MIIGPRYKIARRLGAPVFEKTQNQKFALRESGRGTLKAGARKPKAKSEYDLQLIEKQKARWSYGLSAKQFSKYVKAAADAKGDSTTLLLSRLESRLDNVVLRLGLASTRAFARQMVSHGHILVNGKKVNVPSYEVSVGDKIGIRAGSLNKPLFVNLADKVKAKSFPAWLKFDIEKKEGTVEGQPTIAPTEVLFNVGSVFEFYTR